MAEKREKEVCGGLNKETNKSMPETLGIDSYGHESMVKPEARDHEGAGVDFFE